MIEFLLWMALQAPEASVIEYHALVTRKVHTCPKGYQLVRWHEHYVLNASTPAVTSLYKEDLPSGYYPVEPEVEMPEQHPDKCVLKNGTGEHDGKKLPSK